MARSGFVDLQLNGYRGVDFSSLELDPQGVRSLAGELGRMGTSGFCATLITSSMDLYRRNLPILSRVMDEADMQGRMLGIHLEGPYLSPADGARGAHRLACLRKPDADEFEKLQDWAGGKIRILTLAPELEGAIELIAHVRRRHPTVISLGHHMASKEILDRAIDAGASMITHLGNGCPQQIHRHRNMIIDQLAEDRLCASIISDGHHLPPEFISVVLRCKGPDRVVVVSDLAPIGGFPPGIYDNLGHEVRLTDDGCIQDLHTPYLVGSARDIASCMRYLRSLHLLSDEDLWKVGRDNPLRVLGVEPGAWDEGDTPEFRW